uniref:Uncharacterized protein n=1 Tax=Acrobeloides nanus TaxID=290746 RepID=A0A914BWC6_9BILA
MKFFIFTLLALVFIFTKVQGQCDFSCTSQATFSTNFDGSFGTATCSNGNDLSGRCLGCCESWGLSRGISKSSVSGFVSSDGSRCTCCGNFCGGDDGGNPQFIAQQSLNGK